MASTVAGPGIGGVALALALQKPIEDSVRISFTGFSQNALNIKVYVYVDDSDFSRYLAVVSELKQVRSKHGLPIKSRKKAESAFEHSPPFFSRTSRRKFIVLIAN